MRVLVLNASLKHGNALSNTEEVTDMVLDAMRKHGASMPKPSASPTSAFPSASASARATTTSGRRSRTSCARPISSSSPPRSGGDSARA